jgi:hypothetical protein
MTQNISLAEIKRDSRPSGGLRDRNPGGRAGLRRPFGSLARQRWNSARESGNKQMGVSFRGDELLGNVSIVHDWLTVYGAERVFQQILSIAPHADIFPLLNVVPEQQRSFLGGRRPTTSFIQHSPFAKRKYCNHLAIMPHAIEQLICRPIRLSFPIVPPSPRAS